jgi:hypothetical protein
MVQCFSLTTNQPTVLFNLVFQPSEQGWSSLQYMRDVLRHLL